MAVAQIDAIEPANQQAGVALKQTIIVIFSKEMDETTLNAGTFFLEGPDSSLISGSQLGVINAGASDFLESPGLRGILKGTYEFSRTDLTTLAEVSTLDTTGDGELYRSKAVLTTEFPLGPGIEYKGYIFSDESATDSLLGGVSERTVFDTLTVVNTGTGDATLTGGYTGIDDTYEIEITSGGVAGTAIALWSRASDAVTGAITVSTQRTLVIDGLFVEFIEGSYSVGDKWSVVVKAPVYMPGNFTWTFATGSGSIEEVPTTASTTTISTSGSTSSSVVPFTITSITPAHRATNLALNTIGEIVIEFSEDIDPATVIDDNVTILGEPVNGDPNIEAIGVLDKTLNVTDNILTITLV